MHSDFRDSVRRIVNNRRFEYTAMLVILFNAVIIGVETYTVTPWLNFFNYLCLALFTLELALRFIARDSTEEFFKNRWNLFDLVIVAAGYIPEDIAGEGSMMIVVLRVIRVFRVLRLLRTHAELRLIVTVLIRSLRTLTYNLIVMFIFMYVFAIAGIYLFRLPSPETASPAELAALEQLQEVAPGPNALRADPYGDLSEALFTLMRCMSGDAWSDVRYNLISAARLHLIDTSEVVITTFHILWYILAAFLLINIVVGAVLSNFETSLQREHRAAHPAEEKKRGT